MRLHLPQLFHTKPTAAYSHCAFTSRALGLANMMTDAGYEVFEYGNEGSESRANHVVMMTAKEHAMLFQPLGPTEMYEKHAEIGSPGFNMFEGRLREALKQNVQEGDIVLHPFGRTHRGFVRSFPQAIHVEPFVGYNDIPIGAYRIFESEAWRHYHLGRYETMRSPLDGQPMFTLEPGLARNYSWVILNARDEKEWPLGDGSGDYCLFMGRICDVKGCAQIGEMIRQWDKRHPDDGLKFVFAGQGDFDRVASQVMRGNVGLSKRIDFLGHLKGAERADVVGKARLMLCPTQYVEPGGGSAIEAMLCGTPVLASAWGCFTETVLHGLTGYQCRSIGDWIAGIEHAGKLSRSTIATVARERHSFEAATPQYRRVFDQLALLLKDGDASTSLAIP